VRLVVLGDPVVHSRSPAIHTAALAAFGIDGSYRARRVDEHGLLAALGEMREGRLDGANVTMPHKAAAAAAADIVDGLVAATGAANTLRRSASLAGTIEATNTDVAGLCSVAVTAGMPAGAPILLLGGGGAASAARVAFGDRELRISVRTDTGTSATVPWGEGWPGAVLVNATPVGMNGEALPPGAMAGAVGLIDMAYGSGPTPACGDAVRRGIPVADGLDVLVAQAAESFTWWTGLEAPRDIMLGAARNL